jgi:hypothetical protein
LLTGREFIDGLISRGLAIVCSLSSDRVSSNEGNFSPAFSIGVSGERSRCDGGGMVNRVGLGLMTVVVIIALYRDWLLCQWIEWVVKVFQTVIQIVILPGLVTETSRVGCRSRCGLASG